MRLIAFALLLTATPALAAEQYDLSCQGTKVTKSGGPAEATSLKLRVDLTARKWCLDDCKSVEDIYELSADKVVLQDDVTYNTRTDLQDKITSIARPSPSAGWPTRPAQSRATSRSRPNAPSSRSRPFPRRAPEAQMDRTA